MIFFKMRFGSDFDRKFGKSTSMVLILLFFLFSGGHTVEFTTNTKGSLNLVVDGYTFYKGRLTDSMQYWRCKEAFSGIKCGIKLAQELATNRIKFPIYFYHHHPVDTHLIRESLPKKPRKPKADIVEKPEAIAAIPSVPLSMTQFDPQAMAQFISPATTQFMAPNVAQLIQPSTPQIYPLNIAQLMPPNVIPNFSGSESLNVAQNGNFK